MFYYGQECYFASEHFLYLRITICSVLVAVTIWMEIASYDETNWDGRERKYSYQLSCNISISNKKFLRKIIIQDSQYGWPVVRDRNMGPETVQQYQIDCRCLREKSL